MVSDERWRGCPLPTTEEELITLLKWAHSYGGRVESTWYRVTQPDSSLWMETSLADEAAEAAAETGWRLERQHRLSRRTPWQPWTPETCEQHAVYDHECAACVEADAYCPHGRLLRHIGDHVGEPCWRPPLPDEDEEYVQWLKDGRP